jgi:hypothetical protein
MGPSIVLIGAGSGGNMTSGFYSPFDLGMNFGTAGQAAVAMPRAGTLKNLRVKTITNMAGTFKIFKNNAATLLSCSLGGNPATCSDLTNTVSVNAGDTIAVELTNSNNKQATYTVEFGD